MSITKRMLEDTQAYDDLYNVDYCDICGLSIDECICKKWRD